MAAKKPRRRSDQPAEQKPEEFERFEELTTKLIKVSKAELDAKLNSPKPASPSTQRK
jgi:hypothetical protein